MKRTQIYLGEAQDARLSQRAAASGETKSSLIRRAVDAYLDGGQDGREQRLARFRAALGAAAGGVPRLPRGADYVESLRAADRERDLGLERRRPD